PAALKVRGAHCSCDAQYACEHAAALLISAVEGGAEAAGMPAIPRQARRPPSWDTSLESLLAAGHDAGRPDETMLAIELTLVTDQSLGQLQRQPRPLSVRAPAAGPGPGRPPVRLMARLVQPGKHGGWIGGTLSWGKLDSYGYFGGYPATQVRLLRELLALYRTRVNQPYYSRDERSIELSAFESGQLWPLLDEAGQAGLQLVYGHKRGAVERYREARLCLDVTQAEADGDLAIAPVIHLDGPDSAGPDSADTDPAGTGPAGTDSAGTGPEAAVPVRFIGTEGHGVGYLDRAEAQRSADPSLICIG
ncbi:MAG: hypothetical protein ACLQFM_11740, partial [Terriglobales bacterium]